VLYDSLMALRIYPMSAKRWAQLAGTRLPIDLTERAVESGDRAGRMRAEHDLIQAHVIALLAERESTPA
jgi:hypothetical protein